MLPQEQERRILLRRSAEEQSTYSLFLHHECGIGSAVGTGAVGLPELFHWNQTHFRDSWALMFNKPAVAGNLVHQKSALCLPFLCPSSAAAQGEQKALSLVLLHRKEVADD